MRQYPRGRSRSQEAGFTLIELSVAMVLLGILMATAAPAWNTYQANQQRVSASQEVVSVLRAAQIRATAEETTYRVNVDATANTLTVFRFDGSTYIQRSISKLEGDALLLQQVAFTDKNGASTSSAYFYARGTASPGKVVVALEGRSKQHVITVEGLTGRVSST